jgi:hypothetical protein
VACTVVTQAFSALIHTAAKSVIPTRTAVQYVHEGLSPREQGLTDFSDAKSLSTTKPPRVSPPLVHRPIHNQGVSRLSHSGPTLPGLGVAPFVQSAKPLPHPHKRLLELMNAPLNTVKEPKKLPRASKWTTHWTILKPRKR